MISVVIPAYNANKTIIQTLDSVKNQTYKGAMEVIVINDGSTDDTLQIVRNYAAVNKQMDIKIIDKPNGGVSTARNAGLKAAKGDFIALLDSDDEWADRKIERQMEIFDQFPEIDFLGTTRNDEHFKKVLWKKFDLITKISAKFLLVKFIFVVPTIMFKSKILNEVGFFDETQRYAEEGNYFIRIANKFNCCLLNESLVLTGGGKAHFGFSGLSGNIKEMEKGELKNIKNALNMGIINWFEFNCVVGFSLLKYIRRILIVKLLR